MKKVTLCLCAVMLLLYSCDDSEMAIEGNGEVLIFHEGGFQKSNASIGSYDTATLDYMATAYKNENGAFIGDVQQSVLKEGGFFYSVLNGSKFVQVFDAVTLKATAKIQDSIIDKPRYMSIRGNTGYLSIWGPYNEDFGLVDSKIAIIDLNTSEVTGTIDTDEGVEFTLVVGNRLLVTRDYFGTYSNLTFINLDNNTVEKDIEMPKGASEIVIDNSGNPWVLCTSGVLVKIDEVAGAIIDSISLGGSVIPDVEVYQSNFYYVQGNAVKSVANKDTAPTLILSNPTLVTPSAININPANGEIYIGDAVDFSANGKIYRYSKTGKLLDSFVSGISPTQIVFN